MLRSSLLLALLTALSSACAVARAQEPAEQEPEPAEPAEQEPEPAEPAEQGPEPVEQEQEAGPAEQEQELATPPQEQAHEPPPTEPGPEPPPEPQGPEPPPTMNVTEVPPDEKGLRLSLGLRGGYALQPDQLVAGPHLTVAGILADFVAVDAMVLAGMATEHWTLRISAHLKLIITAGDFRFFPLLGPAAFIYQPRGQFADWCDKLELECSSSAVGMELGIGAGWRALGVEAYLSTGDLPLLTILGSVTMEL